MRNRTRNSDGAGSSKMFFVCPTRTRINPYPSRRAVQSARSRCNSCGERRDLGDYQSFLRLSAQRVACLILRPYDNGGSYNNDSDNGDRYRRRLAWAWSLVLAESCQSSSPVRIAAEPSISSRNVLLLTRRIAIYAVGASYRFLRDPVRGCDNKPSACQTMPTELYSHWSGRRRVRRTRGPRALI